MSQVVRYRHRWKLPNGAFEYEFEGSRWCRTREEAMKTRKGLIKRSKVPENGDYTDYFQEDWEWDVEEGRFQIHPIEEGEVVVLLEEEYGYRHWLWHTKMTEPELTSFWEGLDSVEPYFLSPTGLPGVLTPAWWQEDGDEGVWSYDPANLTYVKCKDEECCQHEHPKGTPVFVKDIQWRGHIHMNDDSGIGRKGKSIRHKGYTG